jgi:hypothetical protein
MSPGSASGRRVARVTHYVVLFGEQNGHLGEAQESPAKSA